MDREDKRYIDLGILETSEELEEKLITNDKDYTTEEHNDYTLYTFKTEYGEQYVYEYKTLKGIMSEIMDNFINNKDYMSDDMTLYIEYKDGSTYYLGGSFDDDKFKKTGIKNVVIDNGTYAVFGDWIPRIEGGALYIETPFTNKGNEELEEDLTQQEQKQLEEIDNLINDLYKLRQQSIQQDGEYGMGNLVFKEMRNMGYLDNLRELKRKLQSKDMSLLKESLLLEGTDYRKQAINIIVNSGLFDLETSTKIIDGLFRQDIHAFNHAPAWLEKYLKGIARMLVDYCNGDSSKAQQFFLDNTSVFEYYLTWVKENREKTGTQLDDEFINKLSIKELNDRVNKMQEEQDKQSKDELSKMKFSDNSNYTLVPIDSYEQLHRLYGGNVTGDGTDKKGEYAGSGGTSWCHTNSKDTYDAWVNDGKNKFYILQRNDWKDIPFNLTTNYNSSGKDDYGNSLIALLVSKSGRLKAATLRCNHMGVVAPADNQYKTYSELSKVAGFNVEEEVLKDKWINPNGASLFVVEYGILHKNWIEYDAQDEEYTKLTKFTIPDSVTDIGNDTFKNCSSLTNITIPNSVTSIGEEAFSGCSSLKSIEIPNSVTRMRWSAFSGCSSLTNITISDGVTSIGDSAFNRCSSLTSITIPDSVKNIGLGAFNECTSLKSITIPNGVTDIGNGTFNGCTSLTNIKISDNVKIIGAYAFCDCTALTNITIPNSVTSIGTRVFLNCSKLISIIIPDSVTSIGRSVFYNCDNLTIYTNNEYVKEYCNENNIKCMPLNK